MILIAWIGLFYMDTIIKTAVNGLGPKVTRTSVHLNDFSTSLIDAKVVLKGLQIGNPAGFSRPYALELGSVAVKVDPDSLFSDVVLIENIALSDVSVTYELSGKTSNLAVLNENIAGYVSSSGDAQKTGKKDGTSADSKKVVIQNLTMTGAKVNLAASLTSGGKTMMTTVDLPDLHLKNPEAGRQPMTAEQTAAYILNLISLNSLDALAKSAYKNVMNASRETIDQAGQAAGKLADSAEQGVNALKGLFAQ